MRARIRTIKPQVFVDADLWEVVAETGMPAFQAFAGLICWADREGRFEWKPRELKVGILPYWDGDFAALMDALERGRFITRYEVDGHVYGHIRTFSKHQRVNHREEQSKLPPPPTWSAEPRVARPGKAKVRGLVGPEAEQEAARREAMPTEAPEEDDEAAMERLTREAFTPRVVR